MRVQKKGAGSILEGDLTPMIDMTFQLIAFFMVLINFDQSEQREGLTLPASVLARPTKSVEEYPITLHLHKDGTAVLGGQEVKIDALKPYLDNEVAFRDMTRGAPVEDIAVIIRADGRAPTGVVQRLIAKCQESSLQKFSLRAMEQKGH